MAKKKAPKAETPLPENHTTLRIPGRIWKDVTEAMEFEGMEEFTTFALNSLVRNCRRISIERKREAAGLPPVPGA